MLYKIWPLYSVKGEGIMPFYIMVSFLMPQLRLHQLRRELLLLLLLRSRLHLACETASRSARLTSVRFEPNSGNSRQRLLARLQYSAQSSFFRFSFPVASTPNQFAFIGRGRLFLTFKRIQRFKRCRFERLVFLHSSDMELRIIGHTYFSPAPLTGAFDTRLYVGNVT